MEKGDVRNKQGGGFLGKSTSLPPKFQRSPCRIGFVPDVSPTYHFYHFFLGWTPWTPDFFLVPVLLTSWGVAALGAGGCSLSDEATLWLRELTEARRWFIGIQWVCAQHTHSYLLFAITTTTTFFYYLLLLCLLQLRLLFFFLILLLPPFFPTLCRRLLLGISFWRAPACCRLGSADFRYCLDAFFCCPSRILVNFKMHSFKTIVSQNPMIYQHSPAT